MTDLNRLARDATFVAVGFGVLAFQRAQVQRRLMEKQVERLTEAADDQRKLLEERLEALADQLARTLNPR